MGSVRNARGSRRVVRQVLLSIGVVLGITGCAGAAQRPARSSYGCMVAVRDQLPSGIPEKLAHCLAAGGIAQRCSIVEAGLAGIGKEFADVFNGGDPSWADWKADRRGIRCARGSKDSAGLYACCDAGGR
jgi:hypothetical protein